MCYAFVPPFSPSFTPPLLNFSGCSVNVYTGPVMTPESFHRSNFGLTLDDLENFAKFQVHVTCFVQCQNMQFYLHVLVKISFVSNHSSLIVLQGTWMYQRHCLGYMNIVLCGGFFDTPTHYDTSYVVCLQNIKGGRVFSQASQIS